MQSFPTLSKI